MSEFFDNMAKLLNGAVERFANAKILKKHIQQFNMNDGSKIRVIITKLENTSTVIHFKKNMWETACGNVISDAGVQESNLTTKHKDVTCKACKRTNVFKKNDEVQKDGE